jgi:hypothetical protein
LRENLLLCEWWRWHHDEHLLALMLIENVQFIVELLIGGLVYELVSVAFVVFFAWRC